MKSRGLAAAHELFTLINHSHKESLPKQYRVISGHQHKNTIEILFIEEKYARNFNAAIFARGLGSKTNLGQAKNINTVTISARTYYGIYCLPDELCEFATKNSAYATFIDGLQNNYFQLNDQIYANEKIEIVYQYDIAPKIEDIEKAEALKVIQFIKAHQTVIKTFDQNDTDYKFIIKQINNPRDKSPQRRIERSKNFILKQDMTVEKLDLRTGQIYKQTYYLNHQHKPFNSKKSQHFTQKTSVSTLYPDTEKMQTYHSNNMIGSIWLEHLLDLNGEKFSWKRNANSNRAFWIGISKNNNGQVISTKPNAGEVPYSSLKEIKAFQVDFLKDKTSGELLLWPEQLYRLPENKVSANFIRDLTDELLIELLDKTYWTQKLFRQALRIPILYMPLGWGRGGPYYISPERRLQVAANILGTTNKSKGWYLLTQNDHALLKLIINDAIPLVEQNDQALESLRNYCIGNDVEIKNCREAYIDLNKLITDVTYQKEMLDKVWLAKKMPELIFKITETPPENKINKHILCLMIEEYISNYAASRLIRYTTEELDNIGIELFYLNLWIGKYTSAVNCLKNKNLIDSKLINNTRHERALNLYMSSLSDKTTDLDCHRELLFFLATKQSLNPLTTEKILLLFKSASLKKNLPLLQLFSLDLLNVVFKNAYNSDKDTFELPPFNTQTAEILSKLLENCKNDALRDLINPYAFTKKHFEHRSSLFHLLVEYRDLSFMTGIDHDMFFKNFIQKLYVKNRYDYSLYQLLSDKINWKHWFFNYLKTNNLEQSLLDEYFIVDVFTNTQKAEMFFAILEDSSELFTKIYKTLFDATHKQLFKDCPKEFMQKFIQHKFFASRAYFVCGSLHRLLLKAQEFDLLHDCLRELNKISINSALLSIEVSVTIRYAIADAKSDDFALSLINSGISIDSSLLDSVQTKVFIIRNIPKLNLVLEQGEKTPLFNWLIAQKAHLLYKNQNNFELFSYYIENNKYDALDYIIDNSESISPPNYLKLLQKLIQDKQFAMAIDFASISSLKKIIATPDHPNTKEIATLSEEEIYLLFAYYTRLYDWDNLLLCIYKYMDSASLQTKIDIQKIITFSGTKVFQSMMQTTNATTIALFRLIIANASTTDKALVQKSLTLLILTIENNRFYFELICQDPVLLSVFNESQLSHLFWSAIQSGYWDCVKLIITQPHFKLFFDKSSISILEPALRRILGKPNDIITSLDVGIQLAHQDYHFLLTLLVCCPLNVAQQKLQDISICFNDTTKLKQLNDALLTNNFLPMSTKRDLFVAAFTTILNQCTTVADAADLKYCLENLKPAYIFTAKQSFFSSSVSIDKWGTVSPLAAKLINAIESKLQSTPHQAFGQLLPQGEKPH
jgi:hypothetical protein